MTFDKAAYQLDYMRRRRAGEPTSRVARLEKGLNAILEKLKGNDKTLAVELRKIAEEALS